MNVDHLPLYQQIAEKIKSQIINGYYSDKEKLPGENSLAHQLNVSRVTIRQALKILEKEHFIVKRKGSGNYISYRFNNDFLERSAQITPFSEDLKRQHINSRNEVTFFELIEAPYEIRQILKLAEHEKVYHFQRIRYGNDKPYSIETTYLVASMFDDLSIQILKGSKFKYYEEHTGLKIGFSHQRVNAINADEFIKNTLQVPLGYALPLMFHTTYLDNGTAFDYSEIIINPKYNEVHYIKVNRL